MKKTLPAQKIGVIKVLKITDLPNGEANMEYEVDDVFIDYMKKNLNLKRKPAKKKINEFVLDLIMKSIEKKDGYAIQKKQEVT